MAEHRRTLQNLNPTKRFALRVRSVSPFAVQSEWSEVLEVRTPETEAAYAGLNVEAVQDIVGEMVSSNTETNITVTYDDTTGKLNFVVPEGLTQEQIEDYVGAMVTGNTETGIIVTYDDSSGKLDFVSTGATDEFAIAMAVALG